MIYTENKHRLSLGVKILLPLLIGGIIAVGFIWFHLKNQLLHSIEEQIRRRAESMANTIDQIAWVMEISSQLNRAVISVGAEKDIETIAIIRRDTMEIVAKAGLHAPNQNDINSIHNLKSNPHIIQALTDGVFFHSVINEFDSGIGDQDYIYILPVSLKAPGNDKLIPGVIFVQLEITDTLDNFSKYMARITLFMALGILLLGGFTYFILEHYVFIPINAIKVTINKRALGDTNAFAEVSRNDELGDVTTAFNEMLNAAELRKQDILEKTNLLNTVIENIPLCFYAKDVTDDYRIILWNKKAEQLFSISKEEILHKTDYEMLEKLEADKIRTEDEFVIKTGRPLEVMEAPYTTPRGKWVAHKIKVPIYDGQGNPKLLLGILDDITETKKQSDALKEATDHLFDEKTRLQTLMDSMLEGIITIDTRGAIQSVNPGAEKMFGYSGDALCGQNVRILMQKDDAYNHDDYLAHYNKTKDARVIGKNRELNGVRKNGEIFPMTLNVKNMTINKELMFVGLMRDITEQRQKEEELRVAKEEAESANSLKSQFLANMSHELRTPMHSIITFSRQGIERATKWGPAEHEENLTLIHDSGKRLLLLLNDLLDLSKLEAGAVNYDMKPSQLGKVINDVLREMRGLLENKHITLDLAIEEDLPLITCDPTKILQVMVNLISNAIKFTAPNSTITVTIAQDKTSDNHILITVKDQGVGIPEDEFEAVFDKFIQSSKTKTGAGGTGLGLAICKEIISGHNGIIWAENSDEGGAIFSIKIPISQEISLKKAGNDNG